MGGHQAVTVEEYEQMPRYGYVVPTYLGLVPRSHSSFGRLMLVGDGVGQV